MFTVTAEPTLAFVDAVASQLRADAVLLAIVTGVYGHLSEATRVAYPYVVLGRRSFLRDAGAMGCAGGTVSLQLDHWSAAKGTYEVHRMLSRVSVRLERFPLVVPGFDAIASSLTCELSEVFDEPDEDKPENRLYHGVQRWVCELHEAA